MIITIIIKLKRSSLTRIKTRILGFSGSIILITTIAFTAYPAYASPIFIKVQPQKVRVFIQHDIPLENKIISRTITENIFTDAILGENLLIEQGLIHTVKIDEPIQVKTEKPQLKTHSKTYKVNKRIHTLFNLPKRRGDIIIDEKIKSIPPFDDIKNL